MFDFWRARRIILYILKDIIFTFSVTSLVFFFIALIPNMPTLSELLLIHESKIKDVLQLITYTSIGFLPIILPISSPLSTALTYSRLSKNSENTAIKSLGLSSRHLFLPAMIFGTTITLLSIYINFYLAPQKNHQFEVMNHELRRFTVNTSIRKGAFSDLFNLMFYAKDVDPKNKKIHKVFIFDDRDPKRPLTTIAQEGKIIQSHTEKESLLLLRLKNGSTYHTKDASHIKVDFQSFDISLSKSINTEKKGKSMSSNTLDDIRVALKDSNIDPWTRRRFKLEYHHRLALSVSCLIFVLLSASISTSTNQRSNQKDSFTILLGAIVLYWLIFISTRNLAKNSTAPVALMMWFTNSLFIIATVWSLKRSTRV